MNIPARYQVIVTIRPKYACSKGRTGVVQAKAPAHLLEGSWPTEALLAQIAMAKHSGHMPLNRQAVAMARLGVPIERSVLADWMGRTGALIAPVVDRMAVLLKTGSSRLYVDETTAPVLDPGRGRTKTGYLWAVLRDDRGWNGPAAPGVVFHYHPGRKGEYADQILMGFDGTIQVDAYGGYSHLARPDRKGGMALKLAFCWAHGRKSVAPKTDRRQAQKGITHRGRGAVAYRGPLQGRGYKPRLRPRTAPRSPAELIPPTSRRVLHLACRTGSPRLAQIRSGQGHGLYAETPERLPVSGAYAAPLAPRSPSILDDGKVDMDSNLAENAIRSPAMNRRNALFAGHDEGGRNRARFASLIGTCKMNGVEPYAYLRDLFIKRANGHLEKDIDDLMPWVRLPPAKASQ